MGTQQDFRIVCTHCAATNRVPAARLGDKPACGRCKAKLFDGAPVDLDAANFAALVNGTDIPVLVDFWAPWCGPCRSMAPGYAQAARLLEPRVRVAKLDTEQAPAIAHGLRIQSIPTIVLFRRGQVVARRSGAVGAQELTRWVESQLESTA